MDVDGLGVEDYVLGLLVDCCQCLLQCCYSPHR